MILLNVGAPGPFSASSWGKEGEDHLNGVQDHQEGCQCQNSPESCSKGFQLSLGADSGSEGAGWHSSGQHPSTSYRHYMVSQTSTHNIL